ncbi:hypothetical protein PGB28_14225 [Primorskyibacter aestuariivivens]|uniref:hypothetical protein n=1 Tax=Primorskyibacter aestuariivivens TaxID=1888912 RepID=UPI0023006D12|nr:hypothetical protein [Primorskyibacter aestuariivivens]MDA7429623.1 hypothetical protein [Primorskyibacter aestuariivivens]
MLHRHSGLLRSALVVSMALALTLACVAAFWALGLNWRAALRDAAISISPVAGYLSYLGIVMIFLAALSAFWAFVQTRDPALFWLGCFCLVFAADDYLMIHEALEDIWSVLDLVVYALILVLFLLTWRAYGQAIGRWAVYPLMATFLFFVLSIVFDKFYDDFSTLTGIPLKYATAFEDIPKLAGILNLSFFSFMDSWHETHSPRRPVAP